MTAKQCVTKCMAYTKGGPKNRLRQAETPENAHECCSKTETKLSQERKRTGSWLLEVPQLKGTYFWLNTRDGMTKPEKSESTGQRHLEVQQNSTSKQHPKEKVRLFKHAMNT